MADDDCSNIIFDFEEDLYGSMDAVPVTGLAAVAAPVPGLAAVAAPVSGLAAVAAPVSGLAAVAAPVSGLAAVAATVAGSAAVAAPVSGSAAVAASSGPAADRDGPSHGQGSFQQTVCKLWLRGICMEADTECEFLHRFDRDRLPVCHFFSQTGMCMDDCIFKHITPDDKDKECPMYNIGFCPNGPRCKHKHIKQCGPPPPPEEVVKQMKLMERLYLYSGLNYGSGPSATPVLQQPAARHVQTLSPQDVPPPSQKQKHKTARGQGSPQSSSNQAAITAKSPPFH